MGLLIDLQIILVFTAAEKLLKWNICTGRLIDSSTVLEKIEETWKTFVNENSIIVKEKVRATE